MVVYLEGVVPLSYQPLQSSRGLGSVHYKGHRYSDLGLYLVEVRGCDKVLLIAKALLFIVCTLGTVLFCSEETFENLKGRRVVRVCLKDPERVPPTVSAVDHIAQITLPVSSQEWVRGLPPSMVEALGGKEAVLAIPTYENPTDGRSSSPLTAPVMMVNSQDTVSLYFRYQMVDAEDSGRHIRRVSCLKFQGKQWTPQNSRLDGQLFLMAKDPIEVGSLGETFLLDRIARLIRKKGVGLMVPRPLVGGSEEVFEDSYLTGEALKNYNSLSTSYYERNSLGNQSDITIIG